MDMTERRLLTALLGGIVGVMLALGAVWLRGRDVAVEVAPGDAKLLAEVLGRIESDYVEPRNGHALMTSAIRGMVSDLDPHSAYMDEEEVEDLRIATEGRYSGIGIEVTLESGAIVVIAPIDDSPAARAGIRPGDRILAIEGRAVDGAALADSIARIRGEPGTLVRLTLARSATDAPFELAVERALVAVHSVRQELLEPGYGYLRISQFSDTTGADVGAALHALQQRAGGGLRGLVLDLRNNPGGVLDAAVEVADAFLERGTIVSAEGRAPEANFRHEARAGDLAHGASLAVLINEGSASAAEIVAGALHDNGRGRLLGRRSFGKGSVQTVLPLPGGQALKLTTSRYYTPSGRSIQERGLEPDVALPEVETGAGDARPLLERDGDVRAALAWLKNGSPALAAADAAAPMQR